jgi:hypothetical protein
MTLSQLRDFFFWCVVINFGLYLLTVMSLFTFKGLVVAMHRTLFGMDEAEVNRAMHAYLGAHKLLTTVFALVPWLALVIMA